MIPQLNKLYDKLRTGQGWRHLSDAVVTGVSNVAAGSTIIAVTLSQPPFLRLSQWPNGVHVFPVVTFWGYAQEAGVNTFGVLTSQFQAVGGGIVNLSVYQTNNIGTNNNVGILVPSPITDPGTTAMGNLVFTLNPGGASTVTIDWAIGFAFAYLLPTEGKDEHDNEPARDPVESATH